MEMKHAKDTVSTQEDNRRSSFLSCQSLNLKNKYKYRNPHKIAIGSQVHLLLMQSFPTRPFYLNRSSLSTSFILFVIFESISKEGAFIALLPKIFLSKICLQTLLLCARLTSYFSSKGPAVI